MAERNELQETPPRTPRGDEPIPTCPACNSQQFYAEQLTWNRQPYDAAANVWGLSEFERGTGIVLRICCAACDTACSQLFPEYTTRTVDQLANALCEAMGV